MQNPWNLIHKQFFNIHPDDEHLVKQHNKKAKSDQQVQRSLPPVPFLGNPLTARVLLLGKNPSYAEADDQEAERLPALEIENQKALTFESKYPFFYLDPDFEGTTGYIWWSSALKELLSACETEGTDAETVLRRLACVQWHPYRSRKAFDPNPLFPTQAYGHYLVNQAIATGRHVVIQYGTANERNWRGEVALPADSMKLSSPQSPQVTLKNMRPGDFERLVKILCAPDPEPAA